MSDSGASHIETVEIEQRKLSRNSNDHKLFTPMSDSSASHIEKLEIEQHKLSWNSNGHNFSLGGLILLHHISRRSKLNNGNSREIQMVITFPRDVWFGDIIYRMLKIEPQKILRNSEGHNFSLGCPIQSDNISSRSRLNNGSSRQIQMFITFH